MVEDQDDSDGSEESSISPVCTRLTFDEDDDEEVRDVHQDVAQEVPAIIRDSHSHFGETNPSESPKGLDDSIEQVFPVYAVEEEFPGKSSEFRCNVEDEISTSCDNNHQSEDSEREVHSETLVSRTEHFQEELRSRCDNSKDHSLKHMLNSLEKSMNRLQKMETKSYDKHPPLMTTISRSVREGTGNELTTKDLPQSVAKKMRSSLQEMEKTMKDLTSKGKNTDRKPAQELKKPTNDPKTAKPQQNPDSRDGQTEGSKTRNPKVGKVNREVGGAITSKSCHASDQSRKTDGENYSTFSTPVSRHGRKAKTSTSRHETTARRSESWIQKWGQKMSCFPPEADDVTPFVFFLRGVQCVLFVMTFALLFLLILRSELITFISSLELAVFRKVDQEFGIDKQKEAISTSISQAKLPSTSPTTRSPDTSGKVESEQNAESIDSTMHRQMTSATILERGLPDTLHERLAKYDLSFDSRMHERDPTRHEHGPTRSARPRLMRKEEPSLVAVGRSALIRHEGAVTQPRHPDHQRQRVISELGETRSI